MEEADKGLDTIEFIGAAGEEQGIFCVGMGRGQLGCIRQEGEAP